MLIIGIDGVRADALIAVETPKIDKLISNATYSMDVINEGTTSSGPSWSSMLIGVWQDKYGVVDNSFNGKNYDEYPYFFKRVEEFTPYLHTVSICQWSLINDQLANLSADVVINVSGAEELETKTIDYLTNQNLDVLFFHFDDVDGAGHGYGYSPDIPQYINTIEKVDVGIGNIMAAQKIELLTRRKIG